jgi:hypothetical protein
MGKSFYKKIDYLEKVAVRMINWSIKSPEKYNEETLISDLEFQDLMKISRATSYRWRSKKIIGYSQNSKKIYFNMKDIAKLLLDNYSEINNDQLCTFGDLIFAYDVNDNIARRKIIKSTKK